MSGFTILLTGGTGFLGKHILEQLIDPACPVPISKLIVVYQSRYNGPEDSRIELFQGDITNKEQMADVCKGVDAVIHSAALVDWGTKKPEEVFAVNYDGTENILNSAKKYGTKAFVFTSSLDATYTGKPLRNIDERQPYPETFANAYCESKSKAEQLVLKENSESLLTCALRPSDIWGEADPYHIESLLDMAKSGFYVRLGNGSSKCQHIYVGNCAYAHIKALEDLLVGEKKSAGKPYFLTDGDAENFFAFFDEIIKATGHKIWPKNLWLPRTLAYGIGAISEAVALLVRPFKYYNPKFSRFAVDYTCTDYIFNSDNAVKDFGFGEKYSKEEAINRTVSYYKK